MFAQDKEFDKLAEGVDTSEALLKLASLHGVELPITQTVFDVIHKKITKQEAIKQLFDRTNIFEF
jgi:glycerol-3-phosphate dehydrogenase (NAD(P)+)